MFSFPRFDSTGAAVGNTIFIGVFVAALVLLARRRRSREVSPWMWALCLLHVSYRGIYVPIGPVLVMASLFVTRASMP